jgi:mevalonate kinase
MLFGEHAVIYHQPCIVTAVNQRINVSAELNNTGVLNVYAPDVGIKNYQRSLADIGKGKKIIKEVKYIEYALANCFKKYGKVKGLRIETKSAFSSKFGFGSSSAITVALIKAVSELQGEKLTNRELFDISYKTVLDVQGVGSGFDLAAAIWGGTLYFHSGGKTVKPIKSEQIPLIVGYTGIKADTTTLVKNVANLYRRNKLLVGGIFEEIGNVVRKAKRLFTLGDWTALGECMNINQGLLESLGVGTFELSNLIFSVRGSGALGAKLSGAGGGDCMIALSENNKMDKIKYSIRERNGIVLEVTAGAPGVHVEN